MFHFAHLIVLSGASATIKTQSKLITINMARVVHSLRSSHFSEQLNRNECAFSVCILNMRFG